MFIEQGRGEAGAVRTGVGVFGGGEVGAKEIGESNANGFLVQRPDDEFARGVQVDGTAKGSAIERLHDAANRCTSMETKKKAKQSCAGVESVGHASV
jgi:hypothetical protein